MSQAFCEAASIHSLESFRLSGYYIIVCKGDVMSYPQLTRSYLPQEGEKRWIIPLAAYGRNIAQ